MNPNALLRALEKGEPGPVYLFHGPELYQRDQALEKIAALIPEGQRDFNLDRFDLSESALDEALAAALTLPFLSPRRVVLVRGLETIRIARDRTADQKRKYVPREDSELLLQYLKDPVPETVLVLMTEDVKAGKGWAKKLTGLCEAVAFAPLTARSLPGAVRHFAGEREIRILPEAIGALLEETGSDLIRIGQEVEKLALAVGPGGEVGIEQVHLLVCGYAYQTMFQFGQAVGDRDVKGSMIQAANLFAAARSSDLYGLIGMLARRFRILWYLAEDGSGKRGKVPASYRVQDWQLREYRRQAAGFTRSEVEKLLEELLVIDLAVKSRPVSFRLMVEKFILSLAGERSFPAIA